MPRAGSFPWKVLVSFYVVFSVLTLALPRMELFSVENLADTVKMPTEPIVVNLEGDCAAKRAAGRPAFEGRLETS